MTFTLLVSVQENVSTLVTMRFLTSWLFAATARQVTSAYPILPTVLELNTSTTSSLQCIASPHPVGAYACCLFTSSPVQTSCDFVSLYPMSHPAEPTISSSSSTNDDDICAAPAAVEQWLNQKLSFQLLFLDVDTKRGLHTRLGSGAYHCPVCTSTLHLHRVHSLPHTCRREFPPICETMIGLAPASGSRRSPRFRADDLFCALV